MGHPVDVLLGYPTDTEYFNRELLRVLLFQCYLGIKYFYFNQKKSSLKAKIPVLSL